MRLISGPFPPPFAMAYNAPKIKERFFFANPASPKLEARIRQASS